MLRRAFEGKCLPQIMKTYIAFIVGGSLTAGVMPLLKRAGVTEYEVLLRDGSCLPIGLETPISMLQFLMENMIVGLPVSLALALLIPAHPAERAPLTLEA